MQMLVRNRFVEPALAVTGQVRRRASWCEAGQPPRGSLVAMAFAQETDYLLLDEPLNSFDMAHVRHLVRMLRGVANRIVALGIGRAECEGAPADALMAQRFGMTCGTQVELCEAEGRLKAMRHA